MAHNHRSEKRGNSIHGAGGRYTSPRHSFAAGQYVVSRWRSAKAFVALGARDLRRLWRKRKALVHAREVERLRQNAQVAPIYFAFALPAAIGGALITAVFLPLAIMSALEAGGDPVDILLLQAAPSNLPQDFFNLRFPLYSLPSARPLVYAFAVLYGVIGLVSGLLMISGGLVKLVITSNGLYWGYYLTKYVSVDLLDVLTVDAFTGGLFNLKLAYILLSFYLSIALSNLLGRDEYSKEKNSFFMSGLSGLFGGWLLGRGFGADAAAFSGMTYLTLSYLTIWAAEILFRPLLELAEAGLGPEEWEPLASERSYSLSEIRTFVSSVLDPDKFILLSMSGVVFLFPFLVAVVYHLVLEGVA